jgi:hypothetical protein
MTKLYDKYELFDLIRGPHPMKHLCDEYNKLKGKNVFKDFFDNGDCEPNEIDWIYNGSIYHCYDGDFYEISCGVRDSFDKTIDIFPQVCFSVGLEIDLVSHARARNGVKGINDYPRLEEFSKSFSIKTFSDFVNAMDSWEPFVKEAAKRIRKNRKDWLEYLSPAPDTKQMYSYIKNNLAKKIKSSVARTFEFKKQPAWDEDI